MVHHQDACKGRRQSMRGRIPMPLLLLAFVAVSAAGIATGAPARVAGMLANVSFLAAAADASSNATATTAAPAAPGVPAASDSFSKLGINVPLELSRPLSGQSATFSSDVTAHSLSVAGSVTFGSPFSSRGSATIDGPLAVLSGITTNGTNIDLGGGSLYAANVLAGITAGDNVSITGPTNHPTISVTIPQQTVLYGGGGGSGTVTSVSAGGGLTGGTFTKTGTLSLDLGNANSWSALQIFGAGATTTDLTVTGGATTSALAITSATSTLLKTSANGSVVPAIAGTDYVLPSSDMPNWLIANGALTPTSTIGILVAASSTIGNATQAGGLTIFGGATTTGTAIFESLLGIGTTSPFTKLSVAGNSYFGGNLTATGTVTFTNALGIASGGTGTSTAPSYGQLLLGNASSGYSLVATSTLGLSPWVTSGSNLSYSTGNVGIGTTSPFAMLSVAGDGYFTGNLTASSTFKVGAAQTVTTGGIYGSSSWTDRTGSGTRTWYAITSSSDGTKLVGVVSTGDIYTSADSGATWTDRTGAGSRDWRGITSSSDGTKLAAAAFGGYIYTSTDSGASWATSTLSGIRNWIGITSSTDGLKLAATVSNGDIYTSTDGGSTWSDRTGAGARTWRGITSSSDGTHLAAVVYSGDVYTSADSGATWTDRTGAGSRFWLPITSSADGTKLAAGDFNNGYIYLSTDSGATWTAQTAPGTAAWQSLRFSSDGLVLVAAVQTGSIYLSVDGGSSWTAQSGAGTRKWYGIAVSSDAMKIAAVDNNSGDVWTGTVSGYVALSQVQSIPFIVDSSTGNIGIGVVSPSSFKLQVGGNIGPNASNSFNLGGSGSNWGCLYYNSGTLGTCASDERLKTDINDLVLDSASSTALDQIAGLRVRSFAYKSAPSTIYHGLIAQEAEQVAPELVVTDASTTMKAVRYGDIQWLLLEALQQLLGKFNALAATVTGFADHFATVTLHFTNGEGDTLAVKKLCIGATCMTEDQLKVFLAGQSASAAASNIVAGSASSTPVIAIDGNNPAAVAVGAAYNDLGARITGPTAADAKLGIRYFVDGIAADAVVIDTKVAGTHTIDYVAENDAGVATSTRTVIVGDVSTTSDSSIASSTPAADTASSTPIVTNAASSTAATSTTQ